MAKIDDKFGLLVGFGSSQKLSNDILKLGDLLCVCIMQERRNDKHGQIGLQRGKVASHGPVRRRSNRIGYETFKGRVCFVVWTVSNGT